MFGQYSAHVDPNAPPCHTFPKPIPSNFTNLVRWVTIVITISTSDLTLAMGVERTTAPKAESGLAFDPVLL
jgi:hypothetical protein